MPFWEATPCVLPIPFGLWIYNDFVKYQDKNGVGIGSSTSWVYSGVFVYGESGNPCEGGHQSVA